MGLGLRIQFELGISEDVLHFISNDNLESLRVTSREVSEVFFFLTFILSLCSSVSLGLRFQVNHLHMWTEW